MPTANKLAPIAAQMRSRLSASQQASADTIVHGLHLTLTRDGDAYRLTIGREHSGPTYEELACAAEAFRAPFDVDAQRFTCRRVNQKTGRSYRLLCYQFRWQERTSPPSVRRGDRLIAHAPLTHS